ARGGDRRRGQRGRRSAGGARRVADAVVPASRGPAGVLLPGVQRGRGGGTTGAAGGHGEIADALRAARAASRTGRDGRAGMTSRGPASDSFEHDDAAYLLGALSSAERAAFEAHLPGCPACTARVAALRPVVGALTAARDEARDAVFVSLASQDGNSAAPDAPTATARADDVTGLVRLVERRRRRARWAIGGVATVAAATIAALAIALASPAAPAPTAEALQMTAVGTAPIRATAAIAAVPWGSKITIDC